MKKIIKLGVLLPSLFLLGGLTGCTGQNIISLEGIKDIIDANGIKRDETDMTKMSYKGRVDQQLGEYIASLGNGVELYRKDDKYNFYSIVQCRTIYRCDYTDIYQVKNLYYATFVYIGRVCFDNLGNKLNISPNEFETLETKVIKDKTYITYIDSSSNKKVYLTYDENDSNRLIEVVRPYESENKLEVGDRYIKGDRFELDQFGADGYYIIFNGNDVCSVFDKNDHFKVTYTIPDIESSFQVGTNIYWQETFVLGEEEGKYDYRDDDIKYDLTTYRLNMINGNIKEVDSNFIFDISYSSYLKNKKDQYVYNQIKAQPIQKNKTLGVSQTYIFDKNLKVLANVTGVNIEGFIKTRNGYYDKNNHILYDKHMNIISTFFANTRYYEKQDVLVSNDMDYFGVVNSKGKIIVDFEYDDIYVTQDANYYWGVKNNNLYLINVKTGEHILKQEDIIIKDIYSGNDYNLFTVKHENNISFIAGTKELLTLSGSQKDGIDVTRVEEYSYTNDVSACVVTIESGTIKRRYTFHTEEKSIITNAF